MLLALHPCTHGTFPAHLTAAVSPVRCKALQCPGPPLEHPPLYELLLTRSDVVHPPLCTRSCRGLVVVGNPSTLASGSKDWASYLRWLGKKVGSMGSGNQRGAVCLGVHAWERVARLEAISASLAECGQVGRPLASRLTGMWRPPFFRVPAGRMHATERTFCWRPHGAPQGRLVPIWSGHEHPGPYGWV